MAGSNTLHLAGIAQAGAALSAYTRPSLTTRVEPLMGSFLPNTTTGTQAAPASPLLLVPNQAYGTATLRVPAAPAARPAQLLDALGRPMCTFMVPAHAPETTGGCNRPAGGRVRATLRHRLAQAGGRVSPDD